ncbi:hypothetical protein KRX54_01585 [Actinomycetaceae bacterium TAE3-ERU4]|nr:hypothetical protein [Actinomycetaceae bacterium TAE3-ERU4]
MNISQKRRVRIICATILFSVLGTSGCSHGITSAEIKNETAKLSELKNKASSAADKIFQNFSIDKAKSELEKIVSSTKENIANSQAYSKFAKSEKGSRAIAEVEKVLKQLSSVKENLDSLPADQVKAKGKELKKLISTLKIKTEDLRNAYRQFSK